MSQPRRTTFVPEAAAAAVALVLGLIWISGIFDGEFLPIHGRSFFIGDSFYLVAIVTGLAAIALRPERASATRASFGVTAFATLVYHLSFTAPSFLDDAAYVVALIASALVAVGFARYALTIASQR